MVQCSGALATLYLDGACTGYRLVARCPYSSLECSKETGKVYK